MSTYQPGQGQLSYSARFCRRCGAAMERRPRGLLRLTWRCTRCRPIRPGR